MIKEEFNTMYTLLMVALPICIAGFCTGCIQDSVMNDRTYTYENDNLGLGLILPKEWEGKFVVDDSENRIDIFNEKVYEKHNGAGLMFSIERVVGELMMKEDMKQAPVSQRIILQGNGYTFVCRLPSDIQYPLDDEELRNDYETMSDQIPEILKCIYLLDNLKIQLVGC